MYHVAIIGLGAGGQGVGSHSIGYAHAYAYQASERCQIVGAADISHKNLHMFARQFDPKVVTVDYQSMLRDARPDILSISTYAGLHRKMVEAAVEFGVRGIWCEKPFALSMDDGLAMVDLCDKHGVKLVVNHQRRYVHAFCEAKGLLKEGIIGHPVEFLAALPDWDLMEMGTHWLDIFRFFADDQRVTWVMGQVRCTGAKRQYGHLMEEHAVIYFSFADGTRGFLDGGCGLNLEQVSLRLTGTEGLIDILFDGTLRVLDKSGWRTVPTQSTLSGPKEEEEPPFKAMQCVLDRLIEWMEGGLEPEVSASNALKSTELYLAAYESALRRDRIDLPLVDQTRFPLEAIVESRLS